MPDSPFDQDPATALVPMALPATARVPARPDADANGDDVESVTDKALNVLLRLQAASDDAGEEPAAPGPGHPLRAATCRRPASGLAGWRGALLLGGTAVAIALGVVRNLDDEAPVRSTPGQSLPGPAAGVPPDPGALPAAPAAQASSPPAVAEPEAALPLQVEPPPRPPVIHRRSPARDTVIVSAGSTPRFEVSASPAAADAPLTYTWAVDGSVVGGGPDGSRTIDATTPGEHTVRVIVTDAAGVSAPPVAWQLVVRPEVAPPQIAAQIPRGDRPLRVAEDDTVALSVRVRHAHGDEGLSYRWLVDGREAGRKPTFRLRAAGMPGTRRAIEARIRDRDGREAAARWRLEITPKLREPEALAWADRFQGAWQRRDLATFRLYGVVRTEREAEALRAQLARQRRYRVQFSQARARVTGPYGSVSFVRQELDGTRVVATVAETFQIEKHASGLVTLRGVPPP